jgi:hypothetical protein
MLRTIEQASLPKLVRCEYNQQGPFCSYSSSNAPISRRRGTIRALCIHLNQATRLFQLSRDPRTFFALAQAIDDLTFARNAHRYDPRKIRTACGKRPVTTPTDHSTSTDQTTDIQEEGSAPLGTSGQDGPNVETGPLHCPAGDHPAASIVSSSACSGSAHRGRRRESRGSRLRRSSSSRRWRQTTGVFGAERIRGELLKLEIRVSKRTIQKDMKQVRPKRVSGQTWKTFLHNHAAEVWACDFLQIPDLFFRSLFAFFIIDLKSRKVIHMNVTRSPTDPWVARTAARSDSVWRKTTLFDSGY